MAPVQYLLFIALVIANGILASETGEADGEYVQPLEYLPLSPYPGFASLASNPLAAAVLNTDKSQYPQLFDSIVAGSIDSIGAQTAPKKNIFSPENFGFNPIASQTFYPSFKSAKLISQPQQYLHHGFNLERPQTHLKPAAIQQKPVQYDIQTLHDPNYKIYKPEEPTSVGQGEEILAALKQNPSVAAYFKPLSTNVEISHPLDYRKEELIENSKITDQNYKGNAYLPGTSRIRRYTDGKRRQNSKNRKHDDEETYDYASDYPSKPKAFDTDTYSSAYKKKKDPNEEYDYPYDYDSGYDHSDYERIKDLSEKQAAEIKKNPGNCHEVKKDGMKCVTCKDPKTGGNYESCSYEAEPKNNQYAYSKERKFDTADEPNEPEKQHEETDNNRRPAKYEEQTSDDKSVEESAPLRVESDKSSESDGPYDKGYYVHSSNPKANEEPKSSEEKNSEETHESPRKSYDYKAAIPGFYTNNEQKKDVEHVLAEFKKKDRSACKKVQKNGMTCFQCIDKSGLKHEECMFISESAPKRSHLAYQELKEFTSKPPVLEGGNEGAASHIVPTTARAPLLKSAAYVANNNGYGRKLKRKKVAKGNLSTATTHINPIIASQQPYSSRKTKRSENSYDETAESSDPNKSDIAPPEEFSGDSSKGAFWAETMPRYSRTLGVTLPEFMLASSEHELSFDETVAGA